MREPVRVSCLLPAGRRGTGRSQSCRVGILATLLAGAIVPVDLPDAADDDLIGMMLLVRADDERQLPRWVSEQVALLITRTWDGTGIRGLQSVPAGGWCVDMVDGVRGGGL